MSSPAKVSMEDKRKNSKASPTVYSSGLNIGVWEAGDLS
jgi:hypothetical protein